MTSYKTVLTLANTQYRAVRKGFICRWIIERIVIVNGDVSLTINSTDMILIERGIVDFPTSHPIAQQIINLVASSAPDRVLPKYLFLLVFSTKIKYFLLGYNNLDV